MSNRDEITVEGDSVTLRPKGVARFFEAAFLAVSLAFWAVGEGVALIVLSSMLNVTSVGDVILSGTIALETSYLLQGGVTLFDRA